MSEKTLKFYNSIRASAQQCSIQPDNSGWTKRLGYSLHDGLRHALSQIESHSDRLERILQLTQGYITYVAATNDLYIGKNDGYSAVISFRKRNNPSNRGEARLAIRTPENNIVFVTFTGKQSSRFLGFDSPVKGFNYWWWKSVSHHWIKRLHSADEINTIGNTKQFYNDNPRIILPNEFQDHVAKTSKTITELLADAVTRAYYANQNDPVIDFQNFSKKSRKAYRKQIHYALIEFLEPDLKRGLEQQLQAWLNDVQLGSPAAQWQMAEYPSSYGTVRYFSECDAEICERRTLFAQTFPFIMPIISRRAWFLHRDRKVADDLRAILSNYSHHWLSVVDVGGKFVQRAAKDLTDYFSIPIMPALVKRFAGLPPELATDQNVALVLANLKHLAKVPFHVLPADGQEFVRFTSGVAKCIPLLDILGQDVGAVCKYAGKNLSDDMARIGEQASAANHLKDYIESVLGKIVLAWAARHAVNKGKELDSALVQSCSVLNANSILQKTVQSRSALRLIEASERWHKAGHQHNFINRNQTFRHLAEGSTDWVPITESVQAPNGYKLQPLTSNLDLQEEGKLVDHCVGGYGWQCIAGNSHIISIQNGAGEHLSTLQLLDKIPQCGDFKREKGLVYQVQHRAYHNSEPSKECLDAAAWYIEKICEGKIDINFKLIQEARLEIEKSKARSLISQKIGYHPEQVDKAEELYGICRDFLPTSWSKPTLDAMAQALGIVEPLGARLHNITVTLPLRSQQTISGNDQPMPH